MWGLLNKFYCPGVPKGVAYAQKSLLGCPVNRDAAMVFAKDSNNEDGGSNKPEDVKKESQAPSSGGLTVQLHKAFKLFNIEDGPATTIHVTKEQALEYFRQMSTIRRLENVAGALYKEKIIRGFCHLYSGQEAIAVGFKAAMRPNDSVITAYRAHGWTYLMGVSQVGLLAELTGRQSGCSRGKGGSMHTYGPRFYGGNGIVGAQVPLGAGIALAAKYRGDGSVCIACYGDGAANQGQIFEAYNMACLWKLPVIFLCENNLYAMGTSMYRGTCGVDFYKRGLYLPGLWVDGMRVIAVRSAAEYAINYAVTKGPIVVEASTYRYSGHSMSDPGTSYRSRDEVQDVRAKRDPITSLKTKCLLENFVTEDEFKAIDEEVKKAVNEAAKIAKEDKEIDLKELTTDVYSKNLEPKIRGITGYTLTHTQINKGANH